MEGLVMIYATISRHALKGQKLLAQGNALGFVLCESSTPCKGKSFTYRRGFSIFIRCVLKLLPLQGASLIANIPRAMPWAKSFCPLPFPSAGDRWFRAYGVSKSTSPLGVPADLQSAVKKVRPIKTGGFVIPPTKGKAYSFAADCKSAEAK